MPNLKEGITIKTKTLFGIAICLCTILLFCGFEDPPEAERNPNTSINSEANYSQTDISKQTFEVNGKILETSNSVPSFKINIPVCVVDSLGNPVQNVGIVTSYTYNENGSVMRVRPNMSYSYGHPVLTNHEGKAVIPYTGSFSQVSLFAIGPDALAGCWGKYISMDNFPSHVCLDVDISTAEPVKEVKIILPNYSHPNFSGFSYSLSLIGKKDKTDYLVRLSKISEEPIRRPTGADDPLPYERLVSSKGKATFPNLESGNWKVEIFDYNNMYNENGQLNPIKSLSFTLNQKNKSRKTIILLPQK